MPPGKFRLLFSIRMPLMYPYHSTYILLFVFTASLVYQPMIVGAQFYSTWSHQNLALCPTDKVDICSQIMEALLCPACNLLLRSREMDIQGTLVCPQAPPIQHIQNLSCHLFIKSDSTPPLSTVVNGSTIQSVSQAIIPEVMLGVTLSIPVPFICSVHKILKVLL